MNLLPNTGLFGRERQDFDALTVFEFLQANPHAVSEFNGVAVCLGFRRKLAEDNGFGGA